MPLADFFVHLKEQEFSLLSVEPSHLVTLSSLPFHHRDPFDRLIAAQAQSESMTLLTQDEAFRAYDFIRPQED